jgi:hypothetical protein
VNYFCALKAHDHADGAPAVSPVGGQEPSSEVAPTPGTEDRGVQVLQDNNAPTWRCASLATIGLTVAVALAVV